MPSDFSVNIIHDFFLSVSASNSAKEASWQPAQSHPQLPPQHAFPSLLSFLSDLTARAAIPTTSSATTAVEIILIILMPPHLSLRIVNFPNLFHAVLFYIIYSEISAGEPERKFLSFLANDHLRYPVYNK